MHASLHDINPFGRPYIVHATDCAPTSSIMALARQATRPLSRASAFVATAAVLATSSAMTGVGAVPRHLHISSLLSNHDFASTKLAPITLTTDAVTSTALAKAGDLQSADSVIQSQIKAGGGAGAVGFVVRRPG